MQGGARVGDPELDDDADSDRHLVRRQNLLPFDPQVALAHVHQDDLDLRHPPEQARLGEDVVPRLQDARQDVVLIP